MMQAKRILQASRVACILNGEYRFSVRLGILRQVACCYRVPPGCNL